MEHEYYMSLALELAKSAAGLGEVPVGCVVVHGNEVIGRGYNRRESGKSALLHAECIAIDEACRALGDWRLTDCRLYVTLEPCLMCSGAIVNSRIGRVYYGCKDRTEGACGSILNVFEEGFGHRPRLYGGVLEKECAEILIGFFNRLRNKSEI